MMVLVIVAIMVVVVMAVVVTMIVVVVIMVLVVVFFSFCHTFTEVQFNAAITIDNKITTTTTTQKHLHQRRTLSDLLFAGTVSEDLLRGHEVLQLFFGILTEPLHIFPLQSSMCRQASLSDVASASCNMGFPVVRD